MISYKEIKLKYFCLFIYNHGSSLDDIWISIYIALFLLFPTFTPFQSRETMVWVGSPLLVTKRNGWYIQGAALVCQSTISVLL